MIKLIVDKLPRIIRARKKLEKEFEVKITNRGKEIFIDGAPENEFLAEKAIIAIEFGFPMHNVFLIKKEELDFEMLNIKSYSSNKNIKIVRGRIIGKNGRALKTLSSLADCFFQLKDNKIGIIGSPENIKRVQEALIMLIKGAKHRNVYTFLERSRPEPIIDLGLKKIRKK